MPLDYQRLRNWREPPQRHAWSANDSILYALGLGLGADSGDPAQLRFVYEQRLQALPTMATVLAPRFGWLYRTQAGIDAALCVHGEQSLRLHRPLPAEGEFIASCILLRHRIAWDAGALRSLRARFVSPLFPGETLLLECWDEADGLRFRCRSKERGVVVLDLGLANDAAAA